MQRSNLRMYDNNINNKVLSTQSSKHNVSWNYLHQLHRVANLYSDQCSFMLGFPYVKYNGNTYMIFLDITSLPTCDVIY